MKLNKISKAFYINLDRRSDRMRHMENNTPFDVERYNAVDSLNLTLTKQIDQLFSKKLNSLTKAEIACSLSHYQLWKQLVNDNDAENYLILEDDAVFKSGFTQFWNQAFSEEIPSNFMLIYLGGCQPWNKPSYHKVLQSKNQYFNTIKKNDFFTPADHYWHMNASSYIISKQAASLLCQWVDQQGFDAALDVFMIMFFNKNKLFSTPDRVYHLNPLMSYQLHEKNNNTKSDKNSDIRFNKDKFTKTKHKISVVIPTIWRGGEYMIKSLLSLDKTDEVDEVIIINNNLPETPNWINQFKKINLIDPKKSMYFNASVNLGVSLCKNDICCIYNDDIIADMKIFNYVSQNYNSDDGCIFISPKYINRGQPHSGRLIKIKHYAKDELHRGSGSLLFLRKNSFVDIPQQLVHHFGDSFIYHIYLSMNKPSSLIEGFPIETPGSASSSEAVHGVIRSDWKNYKPIFDNIGYYINSIPKVLHVSWNNKDILSSQSPLILNGLKNFETINPDWKIEISDDDDVDNYIKKHVSVKYYNLIKNKHIVQKTDLWRLLKVHNEGGLYIDIDRYVNIPMAKIINKHTKCILPICGRSDFSQDFVCGVPNFYIHKNAINSYLKCLELGKSVFECGPISYMHSVSESLCGYKAQRRPGNKFWNDAINTINQSPDIESYIEGDSFDKILFKYDPKTFVYLNGDSQDLYTEFKNQKADFYNSQSIEHWNINDRNYHKNYKNNNQQLTLIWQVDPRDENQSYESDWLAELFSNLNYKEIIDCNYSVFQDNAIVIYNDIWPKTQESPRQEALYNYLDKISKYDNVSIVHLGDEFTHAKTEHYKNFKTVIRTTYKDSVKDFTNLIQIPLGYKQGF